MQANSKPRPPAVEAGETAAGYVAPAYLDVQVGWGLIGREIPAIAKGKCH